MAPELENPTREGDVAAEAKAGAGGIVDESAAAAVAAAAAAHDGLDEEKDVGAAAGRRKGLAFAALLGAAAALTVLSGRTMAPASAAAAAACLGRSLKKRRGKKAPPAPSSSDAGALLSPDEVRDLLDFAIVGFPKTGTSFMEHYLFDTEETHLDNREHCLGHDDGINALSNLVNAYGFEIGAETRDGVPVKNAIKCPHEIYGEFNLGNYEKFFPEMKFIVSTRHPVLWFQSWYNYKLRQVNKHRDGEIWAPPTRDLIGPCAEGTPYHYGAPNKKSIKEKRNVCTDGAKFHHALSRFGKTPMSSREELALLENHEMSVHSFPGGKIFLMELGQFGVEDRDLADRLLRDMKAYLGLEHDLPPLYQHESKPIIEEVKDYVIDICDDEHALVRAELTSAGRDAYVWIRDYFLESPDVVVSSKDHFLELIAKWQYDPCQGEEEQL